MAPSSTPTVKAKTSLFCSWLDVRSELVIHDPGRFLAAGIADDLGRDAGDGAIGRHVMQHHRARRDPGAMADLDIAEDLGAGADEDAMADLRMPVAGLLAGAAERHFLHKRHIVLDHRGLADDDAMRMIDEDAAPDARRWMDIDGIDH